MYFLSIFRKDILSNLFVLAGIFLLAGITTVHSELRLCNKTESEIEVAIGYHILNSEELNSEGWWSINGNTCEVLIPDQLTFQSYYIYALDHINGGEWGGENYLCTKNKRFTIEGNSNCFVRGFERTGFLEIKTGQQKSWTINLTETMHQRKGG